MLPLAMLWIVFFFMAVGAVAFSICALIEPWRRYALSAALWCALWGPAVAAWILLAGLAAVAAGFAASGRSQPALPHVPLWLARSLGILPILGTAIFATAIAWAHQVLARRMTYVLFRIYATCVCAGIGTVCGWSIGFFVMFSGGAGGWISIGLLVLVPILGAAFGVVAWRHARQLRGPAPERFTWVTREEYDGNVSPSL